MFLYGTHASIGRDDTRFTSGVSFLYRVHLRRFFFILFVCYFPYEKKALPSIVET